MIRRRLLPLVAGICTLAVSAGCTEEVQSGGVDEPGRSSTREPGPASAAGAGSDVHRTQVYSERDAVLYSRLGRDGSGSGVPVDSIEARVGDRVETGEVLAVLEDDEARLAVQEARAPYEAAAAEVERLETLHERDAASTAELERARFEMQRRKAALDRAELTLRRTRIRAPFAGVVSERSVRVGQHVTPDMPLFRVTRLSPLRARLQLPEGHPRQLGPGSTVTVRGLDGDTAAAEVVTVGPTIDAASGTREVVVELLDGEGFEPGATVSVQLGGGTR